MSYSKSNYEFLKSRGICTKCGKRKAVNKLTYCEYCLEKDVIKNAKYREKNRDRLREENKKRMQNLRNRRKQNGECTKCGRKLNQVIDGSNTVKCRRCKAYYMEYMRKRRSKNDNQKMSREEKIELKICLYCNSKAMKNKKLCEKHYNAVVNNLSKVDRNSNHSWRKYDNSNTKKDFMV